MADVTGIIKAIIGQAFAISPDGSRRLLVEGDKIFAGEQIETGADGAVTVSLANGKNLDLGRDSLWDSASISPTTTPETTPTDVAAIQQAIADGQDPTQILEATAAGPQTIVESGGAPGVGGSHTHVILDLTGEVIDPTAGYPTEGLEFPDTDIVEEQTILNPDENIATGDDTDADADA
ncbi:TPA: retention module-containing protein, partial [Kluyvera ascorbata]|nr:retention module-containing protein [Kluyvera ascorbata]